MNSSSSQSNPSTNQTDNRRVIGQGGVSAESGSVVNYQVLDGEVVNRSLDSVDLTVKNALSTVDKSVGRSFDFAVQANSQALDSLNTTSNLVKDAYADAKGRGAMTDKILIGSVVMAGLVAIAALRK